MASKQAFIRYLVFVGCVLVAAQTLVFWAVG